MSELSPTAYWSAALARVTVARFGLKGKDPAAVWRQLEWLTMLEQFARACLELASEPLQAEARKRQVACQFGQQNEQKLNDSRSLQNQRNHKGEAAEIAAKAMGTAQPQIAGPAQVRASGRVATGFRFG
jgi:hypothetical protein